MSRSPARWSTPSRHSRTARSTFRPTPATSTCFPPEAAIAQHREDPHDHDLPNPYRDFLRGVSTGGTGGERRARPTADGHGAERYGADGHGAGGDPDSRGGDEVLRL